MYFTSNDLTLYYEKHGQGNKIILILPGWGNTRETFHNMISYFKENYTIYIVDYPGLGNSPTPNKDLTIYDYATLIINFIKEQGLQVKEERGHRIFPVTDKARDVLECFIKKLKQLNVKILLKGNRQMTFLSL